MAELELVDDNGLPIQFDDIPFKLTYSMEVLWQNKKKPKKPKKWARKEARMSGNI